MERRFETNDFEQFLKQNADEFKITPSKKVWHGIYNDMHPGRRWPSITISLLLIFSLVFIGHLNTHNGSKINDLKNNPSQLKTDASIEQQSASKNDNVRNNNSQKESRVSNKIPGNISSNSLTIDESQNKIASVNSSQTQQSPNGNSINEVAENTTAQPIALQLNSNAILADNKSSNSYFTQTEIEKTKVDINSNIAINPQTDKQVTIENTDIKKNITLSNTNIDNTDLKEKNDVKANKASSKSVHKRNNKISWLYFADPEINNVAFNDAPISPALFVNATGTPPPAQTNYKVLHSAALGFEAGIQMRYAFANKIKFTSGLHVTYSGYNITSNDVHPEFATLILKNHETGVVYSERYITHYGDGTGLAAVTIKNFNMQVSLPVGLQYQLSGNNKVQFNISADVAPSYIFKSHAYLLSSDGKNYINDPSLMRKINMSSNFGLFASFSSNKFIWQIGPDLRYQWLSTYKRDYTVKEHLIDYGIRIGISPIRNK